MINKAIKKIKAEIDGSKNNPYIQVVGGFLLQHLAANPSNAEKVIQEGKTIGASLDEMKKEAGKKKVGGCSVLTDHEGFAIVLKYFGIDSASSNTVSKVKDHTVQASVKQEPKAEIEFKIELDF